MVEVIAKQRIGRKRAGASVRMSKAEARAAVAIGLAAYRTTALEAPVAAPPVKRQYRTRALKVD